MADTLRWSVHAKGIGRIWSVSGRTAAQYRDAAAVAEAARAAYQPARFATIEVHQLTTSGVVKSLHLPKRAVA